MTWGQRPPGESEPSDSTSETPTFATTNTTGGFIPPPPPPGTWAPVGGSGSYSTGAGGAAGPVRSLRGLSIALAILLGIDMVVSVIAAALNFNLVSKLDTVADDYVGAVHAENQANGAAAISLLLRIAIFVLLIIWTYRLVRNAIALAAGRYRGMPAGMAIGGYFIPIANYLLIPLIMQQSITATKPRRDDTKSSALVWTWWAVYTVASVMSLAAGGINGRKNVNSLTDLSNYQSARRLLGIAFAIQSVAGILAILAILTLSRRFGVRSEADTAAAPPAIA